MKTELIWWVLSVFVMCKINKNTAKMVPLAPQAPTSQFIYPKQNPNTKPLVVTSYVNQPKFPRPTTNKKRKQPSKKQDNLPHLLIYKLDDDKGILDVNYKNKPYSSTAADMKPKITPEYKNEYDKVFYHDHLPPAPNTYDGSVVSHTAYNFK